MDLLCLDVQEFHTLFFDALDRNLMTHPNGKHIRDSIHGRFEVII